MQHTLQHQLIQIFRKELENRKISQQQLADKIGMSRQMIANYLTERTDLTINMLELICKGIDVPIEYILKLITNSIYDGDTTALSLVEDGVKKYGVSSDMEKQLIRLETENDILYERLADKSRIIGDQERTIQILLAKSGIEINKKTGSD